MGEVAASRAGATQRVRLDTRRASAAAGQSSVGDLIADLAVRFVTVEPEAIDDALVDGLRQIAESLQLDRAILWGRAADASAESACSWIRHPQPSLPDPRQLASVSFIASRLGQGEAVWFTRLDEVPTLADRAALLQHGLRSAAVLPVRLSDDPNAHGAIAFGSMTTEHEWDQAVVSQLRLAAGVFGQVLARQSSLTAMQLAIDELHELRERMTEHAAQDHPNVAAFQPSHVRSKLHAENLYLRHEVHERLGSGAIVGQSAAITRVLEQARQVAATNSTVLLLGETGTGKEIIATQIHELSARRGRVMVRVNCSAIPGTLMESEMFGREKGAFTGALARQIGRFESADHSTIFLDEIGDLPADLQVKLLRVLEERLVERLGSPKAIPVDVRVIAATHRNLEDRILEGVFREDLFYRFNVFPIHVPPLRDRPEDIPLLVWRFVDDFSRSFGKRIDAISKENMAALQQYSWPGNIRELRNIVERAMIVATGTQLSIALPRSSGPPGKGSVRMADVEKDHVRSVLERCGWRIRGAGGAADRLGLRPTTLETRMAKLGLVRPKHGEHPTRAQ